jgi:endonuclease G
MARPTTRSPAATKRRPSRARRDAPSPAPVPAARRRGSGARHAALAVGGLGPLAVAALAVATPHPTPVTAAPERPGILVPQAPPGTELAAAPANSATPQCLAHFPIGVPANGADDVVRRETLICRRGYVVAFNADRRVPDWVMERLSPTDLTGPATRSNAFGHDPALPPGADATNADYLRTGYDRGHQAPAGDAKFSQQIMDESFFFTNMAPQIGVGFNRGAWKFLEETVRGWVECGGHPDLYVITGPIYGVTTSTIGANRVAIPREFYKIVYDPAIDQAVGFVLPNVRIGSTIDPQLYVRPIADIETATGLNFFPGFDQRHHDVLERGPGTAWGHNQTCPGDGGD